MASSAAAYLNANPGRRMVILAGSGHVAFGSGIPSRLERRTHATYAIVLSSGQEIEPHMADYLLLSKQQELPAAGLLGVSLEDKDGEARIRSLSTGGAAEKAGINKGDVLAEIDDQQVKTIADMRLLLWDKEPGDSVRISVRRKRTVRAFEIELTAPAKPAPNK
jgi:S1-C subfamily serine protease